MQIAVIEYIGNSSDGEGPRRIVTGLSGNLLWLQVLHITPGPKIWGTKRSVDPADQIWLFSGGEDTGVTFDGADFIVDDSNTADWNLAGDTYRCTVLSE